MDFRLVCEMHKWLENNKYLGDCDIVSLAGASKGIADSSFAEASEDKVSEEGTVILKQIDLAYKLHEVRKVVLLHHSDCGAYKSSYDFASAEDEKNKQVEDMKKSKQIIEDRYFGVEVVLVWAELPAQGWSASGGKDEEVKKIDFTEIQ